MIKEILMIDDDEDELSFFAQALELLQYPCRFTFITNPINALKRLNEWSPDFIFLDFSMPQMSGIHFLAELKKHAAFGTVPVVLYSNASSPALQEEAKKLGMTFMRKVTSIKKLSELLKSLFVSYEVKSIVRDNSF